MPKITKEQIQKIDLILKLLLQYKDSTPQARLFPDKVFKLLNFQESETEYLFGLMENEIKFNGDNIVEYVAGGEYSSRSIRFYYNTKPFIEAGGAMQWFINKLNIQEKEEKRKKLEQLNLENTIEEFKITQEQFKLTKQQSILAKKESRISKRIAISSIAIAIITLILQAFNIL
jgi:hypothetical protein